MAIRRRLAATLLGGSLTATATLVGGGSSAVADTASFAYTGGEQTFHVPQGVTQFHVVAVGGRGGASAVYDVPGGFAAVVTADFSVPPGTTRLFIEVGGVGVNGSDAPSTTSDGNGGLGGFNGGGPGGGNQNLPSFSVARAGGGGGASDVRTCARAAPVCEASATSLDARLVAAAGGGGGGAGGSSVFPDRFAPGGDGGLTGQSGGTSFINPGGGGGGADLMAGGAGGTSGGSQRGESGGLGFGGAGGRVGFSLPRYDLGGGGGGGGLFGGGGGANGGAGPFYRSAGGGGGGGSSFVPAGGSASVDTTGVPSVTLTFTVPPPGPATTPLASGHTASSVGRLAATGGTGNGGALGLVLLVLGGCGLRLARRGGRKSGGPLAT